MTSSIGAGRTGVCYRSSIVQRDGDARDANANTTAGYRGTIHFTSGVAGAVLPANYTFIAADNGVHTFSITLNATEILC